MSTPEHIAAGQAVYTPMTLRFYDWFVLGFSNRFLWRCPTSHLEAMYKRNVSGNHIDIGVGTGYFLDKVQWPTANPHITLVDLNSHNLEAAATRIKRFSPVTITANIFEPLPAGKKYDSIALCYLLHCLPETMSEKAIVFDHILAVANDGASIFGATIVQGDAPRSPAAKAVMNFYNRKGIFSNRSDTHKELGQILEARFDDVRLQRHGAVTIFGAKKGPLGDVSG